MSFLSTTFLRRHKYPFLAVFVVALSVGIETIFPTNTWASSSFIMNSLAQALYYIFFQFAALLVALSGSMLDFVVRLDSFDVPVVKLGWQVVRDICNMAFILILLVIAFGTILRIPAYSARQLLPRLIVGALLINFSKTISFLFINLSQVLMQAFLAPFGAGAGAGLASKMRLEQVVVKVARIEDSTGAVDPNKITGDYITGILFGTVFMAIAAFVFFVYAIVLVVRVVALWILVTLSPLAFVLGILPGKGQALASRWWNAFGNQALVGPAVAFFLYLGLVSAHTIGQIQLGGQPLANISTQIPGISVSLASKMNLYLQFVFTVAFMLAGLQAARELSAEGMKLADRAVRGGKNLLRNYGGLGYIPKGVKMAKQGYEDVKNIGSALKTTAKVVTTPVTAPVAAGVKAYQARRERGVSGAVKAGWRSVKEAVVGSPMKRYSEQSQQVARAGKELQDKGLTNTSQMADIILRDARSGNADSQARAQAAAIQIAQNGDQADYIGDMTKRALDSSDPEFKTRWAEQVRNDLRASDPSLTGLTDAQLKTEFDGGNVALDPSMFGNIIKAQFGYNANNKDSSGSVRTANLMSKLDDVAVAKGNAAYAGTTTVAKSGAMHVNTNPTNGVVDRTQTTTKAVRRFTSQGADKGAANLTADMLVNYKYDVGSKQMVPSGLSDAGRQILSSWTQDHTDAMKKSGRIDTQNALRDALKSNPTSMAEFDALITGGNTALDDLKTHIKA